MKKTILFFGGVIIVGAAVGAYFIFENKFVQINANDNKIINANISSSLVPFGTSSSLLIGNFCSLSINPEDRKFCSLTPKLIEPRGIQIDLTNKKALLYDGGALVKIIPVAYQSPEGVWFQTPTGYFTIGVKRKEHTSSLFPVKMPYSMQLYEDFFLHEIPYFKDGTKVTSQFSGGCLRFDTEPAKELYDFAKTGDQVVVYKTFEDMALKNDFHAPVNLDEYWIRQRFNSPLRQFWENSGNLENLAEDYYEHTGVDFAPNKDAKDLNVYAIYDGKVALIQTINTLDHGLGNTIILEHEASNEYSQIKNPQIDTNSNKIYSLYAHLDSINNLREGDYVAKGAVIGQVGNSGYQCKNYWKVGKDFCSSSTNSTPIITQENKPAEDTHLHFELKKSPVLENPEKGMACKNKDGSIRFCYGYTPDNPQKYGYLSPMDVLFEKK